LSGYARERHKKFYLFTGRSTHWRQPDPTILPICYYLLSKFRSPASSFGAVICYTEKVLTISLTSFAKDSWDTRPHAGLKSDEAERENRVRDIRPRLTVSFSVVPSLGTQRDQPRPRSTFQPNHGRSHEMVPTLRVPKTRRTG
jgi:hypothetical protein